MSISDWSPMLTQSVTVQTQSGYDSYGSPTYGASNTYSARVVYRNKRVLDQQGNEVIARGEVWLETSTAIQATDLMTLPDGTTPPIVSVENYPVSGAHHSKVIFM